MFSAVLLKVLHVVCKVFLFFVFFCCGAFDMLEQAVSFYFCFACLRLLLLLLLLLLCVCVRASCLLLFVFLFLCCVGVSCSM